jgi:hypothetical protein
VGGRVKRLRSVLGLVSAVISGILIKRFMPKGKNGRKRDQRTRSSRDPQIRLKDILGLVGWNRKLEKQTEVLY